MDELRQDADFSQIRPSRRARVPARNPLKAIGKHGRALRRSRRAKRERAVQVRQSTDLTRLEGGPTDRADPAYLKIRTHVRPLRGEFDWMIETPSESPQGVAMTVVILLGAGAMLGGGGFVALHLWGFPHVLSVIIVALLFVSPFIAFFILRPRR